MLYILQVTAYSTLFFVVYLCFLRGSKAFGWARVYLLLCACLPPLLPLMRLPGAANAGTGLPKLMMPVIYVVDGVQTIPKSSIAVWWGGYVLVFAIMLISLALQYVSCLRFLRRFPYRQINGAKLITNCGKGPGSFGNYIFFADNELQEETLRHELAHVRLRHTTDVLLANVLRCFFWPNVVLHFILRELRAVHEFQADEQAAGNKQEYVRLLLGSVFQTAQFPLTHTFFNHQIKRRIIMLQKKPLSSARLRTIVTRSAMATLLLSASVVYLQSCTRQQDTAVSANAKTTGTPMAKAEMPQPGVDIATFMAEHLKYPAQAKDRKIEGKVAVSFTVNEQGETVNATIATVNISGATDVAGAKGGATGEQVSAAVKEECGKLFEEEALRVVKLLPRWKPALKNGRAVAAELCIPIAFKLQ